MEVASSGPTPLKRQSFRPPSRLSQQEPQVLETAKFSRDSRHQAAFLSYENRKSVSRPTDQKRTSVSSVRNSISADEYKSIPPTSPISSTSSTETVKPGGPASRQAPSLRRKPGKMGIQSGPTSPTAQAFPKHAMVAHVGIYTASDAGDDVRQNSRRDSLQPIHNLPAPEAALDKHGRQSVYPPRVPSKTYRTEEPRVTNEAKAKSPLSPKVASTSQFHEIRPRRSFKRDSARPPSLDLSKPDGSRNRQSSNPQGADLSGRPLPPLPPPHSENRSSIRRTLQKSPPAQPSKPTTENMGNRSSKSADQVKFSNIKRQPEHQLPAIPLTRELSLSSSPKSPSSKWGSDSLDIPPPFLSASSDQPKSPPALLAPQEIRLRDQKEDPQAPRRSHSRGKSNTALNILNSFSSAGKTAPLSQQSTNQSGNQSSNQPPGPPNARSHARPPPSHPIPFRPLSQSLPSSPAPVPALTDLHYACYQSHRTMLMSRNQHASVACMTCHRDDHNPRWRCTWCCLRICRGCFHVLEGCEGRNLKELVDLMANRRRRSSVAAEGVRV